MAGPAAGPCMQLARLGSQGIPAARCLLLLAGLLGHAAALRRSGGSALGFDAVSHVLEAEEDFRKRELRTGKLWQTGSSSSAATTGAPSPSPQRLRSGMVVALQGFLTKKWCSDKGWRVLCEAASITDTEQFEVFSGGFPGRIALRSRKSGKFCMDDSTLDPNNVDSLNFVSCEATFVSARELFAFAEEGTSLYLQGGSEGLWCTDGSFGISCAKRNRGDRERFLWQCLERCGDEAAAARPPSIKAGSVASLGTWFADGTGRWELRVVVETSQRNAVLVAKVNQSEIHGDLNPSLSNIKEVLQEAKVQQSQPKQATKWHQKVGRWFSSAAKAVKAFVYEVADKSALQHIASPLIKFMQEQPIFKGLGSISKNWDPILQVSSNPVLEWRRAVAEKVREQKRKAAKGTGGKALYIEDGRACFRIANWSPKETLRGWTDLTKGGEHTVAVRWNGTQFTLWVDEVQEAAGPGPFYVTDDPDTVLVLGAEIGILGAGGGAVPALANGSISAVSYNGQPLDARAFAAHPTVGVLDRVKPEQVGLDLVPGKDFALSARITTGSSNGVVWAKALPSRLLALGGKALFLTSGHAAFDTGSTSRGALRGGVRVADNQEHEVSVVWAGGQLQLFVDGVLDASRAEDVPQPDGSGSYLTLVCSVILSNMTFVPKLDASASFVTGLIYNGRSLHGSGIPTC